MRHAVLAFLLALVGPPATGDAPAPAALVAQQPRLTPAVLLGAWQGSVTDRSGSSTRSPLEVIFTDGVRPATILGYFRFGDGDDASTLRRLGRVTTDQVIFALAEGGKVTLRLDESGRRLFGSLVEGARGEHAVIELWRLRQPGRSSR